MKKEIKPPDPVFFPVIDITLNEGGEDQSPTIAKCCGCGFVGPWSSFHTEWECESWEMPQQYQVAYCLFCEGGEVEPWGFRISLRERIHNTRLRLARWINPNKE